MKDAMMNENVQDKLGQLTEAVKNQNNNLDLMAGMHIFLYKNPKGKISTIILNQTPPQLKTSGALLLMIKTLMDTFLNPPKNERV